jgi:L-alanine-DL-glutamate epimerase-like enolase superfamily enzyme
MKIYPFRAADHYLSNQDLEQGMRWIRDIRDSVGNDMDICVDCWGVFDFPSAQRIAKALEPYNIMYLEDAMLTNNVRAYAQLAAETSVPICMSETFATRYEYREFFETRACDVVMYDLTWCGGPSEGKKISDMADSYLIPTSPHTCGGPLLYSPRFTSARHCPAFSSWRQLAEYAHQYPYFINNVPVPERARESAGTTGIGVEIKPEIFRNGDAIVEMVAAA